ncbi:M16 family metallopeptidase [Mesorhizobium quangtriensis]|uniref:M16 family metallopeptidase n=1 Tax=Mesorhizobium quangtriensis TaxID=3157709 RepID=UPI003CCCDCE2
MTKLFQMTRVSAFAFLLALGAATPVPAFAEVAIQEVKSDKGITAWLVEDYTVPIVTIRFSFQGGNTQDPPGKEGLSELISGLFDEGAGEFDSDTFQTKLDEAGAEMRFGAGRDTIYGSMRMLADRRDEALDLLKLAVEQPRFDAAPIDRIRAQIVAGIVANARDPETAAQVKWQEALYGDHPYARPDDGTEETLATITVDDLRAYHKAIFAKDTLNVSVVGAIDAETLKRKLDDLFGELPEKADLRPVPMVDLKLGQEVRVDYDLPQTSLQLAFPGVARSSPDFFPAYVMNEILGGGGAFSSRLFNEVREKRGLAYGVSSGVVTNKYSSGLVIRTATRSDRAPETLGVIRDVIRRMTEEGPTEKELAATKKYIIGSYALNNLDSSEAIAATLLSLQQEDLGIDYMQRRDALINGVTLEQVKEVARKLLSVEPAILVIGPAFEEGTKG